MCKKYKIFLFNKIFFIYSPTPMYKIVPWVLVLSSNFLFYVYLRFKPGHTTLYGPNELEPNKKTKK